MISGFHAHTTQQANVTIWWNRKFHSIETFLIKPKRNLNDLKIDDGQWIEQKPMLAQSMWCRQCCSQVAKGYSHRAYTLLTFCHSFIFDEHKTTLGLSPPTHATVVPKKRIEYQVYWTTKSATFIISCFHFSKTVNHALAKSEHSHSHVSRCEIHKIDHKPKSICHFWRNTDSLRFKREKESQNQCLMRVYV